LPRIVRSPGVAEANVRAQEAQLMVLRQQKAYQQVVACGALGYVQDRYFVIEWRFAGGRYDLIPDLIAELVRANIEVIVLATEAAIRPAQDPGSCDQTRTPTQLAQASRNCVATTCS
jgi:hypothetical protein